MFQESVGLIGVAEVGAGADHIGNLLSKLAQNCCRCRACRVISFLLNLAPINPGSLAAEPLLKQRSLFRIGCFPGGIAGILGIHDFAELPGAGGIEFLNLWEYLERILGITAQSLYGVYIGIAAQRCAVSLAATLIAGTIGLESALTHNALTYNKGRFAIGYLRH